MKEFLFDSIRVNPFRRSHSIVKAITEINCWFNLRLTLSSHQLIFRHLLQNKLERDYKDEKQTYDES